MMPIFTSFFGLRTLEVIFFHLLRSGDFLFLILKYERTLSSNFSLWKLIGASYIVLTSTVSITFSIETLQNKDIFFLSVLGICFSDRQIIISGWIPKLLSSLTECCVG